MHLQYIHTYVPAAIAEWSFGNWPSVENLTVVNWLAENERLHMHVCSHVRKSNLNLNLHNFG